MPHLAFRQPCERQHKVPGLDEENHEVQKEADNLENVDNYCGDDEIHGTMRDDVE